jgi:hypothetical protein
MKSGLLSKYFPPPKFLKPPHIGLSFSDSGIKAIWFDKTLEEPKLKDFFVELEKGAIVSGAIINMEEVVKKLLLAKESLGNPFVFFSLPDELAYIFSASTTVAAGGSAAESVAFIIEENVPLPLQDIVFDFVPTGIEKTGSELTGRFVVSASAKKEVFRFLEALRRAGFEPIGCIPESQAIAKAVISKDFSGSACIVHTRENRIGIYLVQNGLVCFSTLRAFSGKDYKEEFMDEYNRFWDYYLKTNEGKGKIEYIFVCGEFEYAKQTVEALVESGRSEAKNVKLSNVWTNVFEIDKQVPEIPYEKSLNLVGSIGAVLSEPL